MSASARRPRSRVPSVEPGLFDDDDLVHVIACFLDALLEADDLVEDDDVERDRLRDSSFIMVRVACNG